MKKSVWICLAVEAVLVIVMAFFGNYRELQEEKQYLPQIMWRLALAAPVLFIVLESALSAPARYKTIMAAALVMIFAADITLIFKFEAGLAVFMLVHILNTVNFTLVSGKITLKTIVFIACAAAGFMLYKFTLEAGVKEPLMRAALLLYMFAILVSFWRALETAGAAGSAFTVMISAGTLIFFIGDYLVARDVFLMEQYHQIVNNTLYYVPHVMLALSAVVYRRPLGQGERGKG